MKDQYFADKRDFFKWGLLQDLVAAQAKKSALCYVAMLTPPDGTKEGVFRKYEANARRPELHAFLQACATSGRREVKAIREYFAAHAIEFRPIGDTRDQYYSHATREAYFRDIPDASLQDAVVFLDPDIGLSAGSDSYLTRVGIDKYLIDEDLHNLSLRIGTSSVLVVYQHLQRDRSRIWDDIEERCLRLCRASGATGTSFVTDRDVAFLVTAKAPGSRLVAARAIVEHAHRHGLDCGEMVNRGQP